MNEPNGGYEFLGVKAIVMVAGFFGGVISMAFVESMSSAARYFSVFSGVCCAMFFTPAILHLWGFLDDWEPGVAFILGIGGMAIVGKIHAAFKNANLIQLLSNRIANKEKRPTEE